VKLVKAFRPTKNKGESKHSRRIPLDDAPVVFRRLTELAEASTALSAWKWTIATQ
jgi:hypothetical protein